MTTSQKTRDALLSMESREREMARCTIVKRLKADADDKVKVQREEIKKLEGLIKQEKHAIEIILKGCFGLTYTDRYGCTDDVLHPDLISFDAETNTRRREILTQK